MKKLLLLAVLTLTFISCEESELEEVQPAQVVGEWQMYRNEKLESIIDQWTGSEWTYVDKWFKTTRDNSPLILEFKEDGTFVDRYADITTGKGVWGKIAENSYYFEYIQDGTTVNEQLTQKRYITFYCDNTYTVEIKGDERVVYYYKETGNTACSDLITYKVLD
jgi:hypothetical protein